MTRSRRALLAALCSLVLPLTACGSGQDAASQKWYQAADGSNVDAGDIAVRGVVVVSDGSGAGTVIASFTNPTTEPEAVAGITVNGQPTSLATAALVVPARGTVTTAADDRRVTFSGVPDVLPGRLATVGFTFGTAPAVETSTIVREPTGVFEDFAPPPPAPEPAATPTPTG